jgi:drug/metabolite transporter (DMT)-like permease
MWLLLSGVIGLALGDASLFHAYVRIGAALSMLIFSTTPVFTALLGLTLLGETLTALEWLGIAATRSGRRAEGTARGFSTRSAELSASRSGS